MENKLGKKLYSPKIYAYNIRNKCSSKSTGGIGDCLLLQSLYASVWPPQNPAGRVIAQEAPSQSHPHHPSRGTQGRGYKVERLHFGCSLTCMQHGGSGAYEMYIQTPGRGPPPRGTEQGRGPSPPTARSGDLRQSQGCISPQRGNIYYSCLFSQPKLEVLSKERARSQKPRCQLPHL